MAKWRKSIALVPEHDTYHSWFCLFILETFYEQKDQQQNSKQKKKEKNKKQTPNNFD